MQITVHPALQPIIHPPEARYRLATLLFALLTCLTFPAQAEIYKYRDSDGNWRFSDTPPAGNTQIQTLDHYSAPEKEIADLKQELLDRYQPDDPIESATLAVVKIKTPLGSGSGFVITENGYIITNKHVVRPPAQTLQSVESQFEEREQWLTNRKSYIDSRRQSLKAHKRNLDRYIDYYNGLSDSEKTASKAELKNRKARYASDKKSTEQYSREYNRILAEHNDSKYDYDTKRLNALATQQFTAVLKNRTELKARLVKLSNRHDLALLKIDNYKLPTLPLAEKPNARQTDKVFAIGSPLGQDDYVTAGIVTSLRKDKIIIDAQILPGNSGGPLLNRHGEVIGVNTWKQLTNPQSIVDGFGIAIPITVAKHEFARYLQEAEKDKGKREAKQPENNEELMKSILEGYQSQSQ